MKVLVVGCGYVGSAVGAELARQGHQVWGVRRNAQATAELRMAGITPVVADLTQITTLAALPSHCDWVIHCPSASGGGVQEYRQVYVEGTRNLLAWLEAARPLKFVYTGSSSVYGQEDGSVVDETSPAAPAAETAQPLLEAETTLLKAVQERQFPAVILRVAGIYGPGRGYWLKQYLAGTAVIEGTGNRLLNIVHRADVSGAIIAALRLGQPGRIYNVVDDEPVSQRVLFEWLSNKFGRALPPALPQDQTSPRKRGLTNKRISNHRLKSELGYSFKYPTFREGFTTEIESLR